MIKINTKATNLEITPAIADYVEKKIQMLDKFFRGTDEVLVSAEIGKTTRHHKSGDFFKAELHITSNGEEYYASAETEDLYASIDKVKDDIIRELTSKRKRALRLVRKGGALIKKFLKGER